MPFDRQETKAPARFHRLEMDGREKLNVSGVDDVSGFDENLVVLRTPLGELNIRGEQLHIERIDLDQGKLELRGQVQELSYDESPSGRSLWGKLFG